ncbi:MAG: GNAT family N-acetyltransferase [Eubacteriales bacterium]|nr:GNAT family N-acetyltransferase [Eubacteriales bacterium]
MEVTIRQVKLEEREILANLLEKYSYEFSQYNKLDVNSLGLYGYPYLDYYWTESKRWAYFVEVNGKLAGFIMVNDYPEVPEEKTDYCISEFFILSKYRRNGVGKESLYQVLKLHRGKWQLKRHPHNIGSVYFWNSVINEYTNGNFRLIEAYPNHEVDYEDGTPADVFFFENKDPRFD